MCYSSFIKEETRAEKATGTRKRTRTQSFKMSELDADDSEVRFESVISCGIKKRRQIGCPAAQNAGEKHCNLRQRQRKSVGTGISTSADSKRITEKEIGGDGPTLSRDNEVSSMPTVEIARENESPTPLIEITSYGNVETQMTTVDCIDDYANAENGVTPEYNSEDEQDSTLNGDDEDDDIDDIRVKCRLVLGRKLWTFFTS
ncbi:Hypothetical predicted protein [Olea europaea subsp. europaea]|uniref:Uncharacterized protein n=1 Tax=Olea europaea subsp. europaea TaxID=158383 RepID=A0A8S0VMA8_OLEEU|nr:Hypothetical predicted protein [Olea europaea subsp. europaea]